MGPLLGLGSLLALAVLPRQSFAQADTFPVPPNLLLLVDTSGSMDYKTSSDAFPTCKYVDQTSTSAVSQRSRWNDLVEVLTGSVTDFECQKLNRSSDAFKTEYKDTSAAPYDLLYANPYHRPVSKDCVVGPGTLATNRALFPPGALKSHPFDNLLGSCDFKQASDGILDAFLAEVRFSLMTFDTDPTPATDVTGLWSYFVNSSVVGRPAGCIEDQAQEVGVRNAEAPPWEGRAVGFGNPSPGSVDFKTRNAMIQQVLLATRPYGATPIAGMLDDAEAYLLSDDRPDPLDTSIKFGPGSPGADPSTACRDQAIVLLSDGQPNLDLRPYCEPAGCPYDKAEDVAERLKAAGIPIYVIGFALASVTVDGTPRTCSSFTDLDFDEANPGGICATHPNDAPIQACCALNRIAAAAGPAPASAASLNWQRAQFADDRNSLRRALTIAIGGNLKTTTRTPVVPASGPGISVPSSQRDFAKAFQLGASFDPKLLTNTWGGSLDRTRLVCVEDTATGTTKPTRLPADESKGDRFFANVNAGGASSRKFFSVVGDSPVKSDVTMRPNLRLGALDGAGTYSGTMAPTWLSAADFVSTTSAVAINVNDITCDRTGVDLDAAACRDQYLKWVVGLDNGQGEHRCPNPSDPTTCSLVGDVYHSVPRVVGGRPSEFLNDESYQRFADAQLAAKRPTVVYVSTNDGFLHAFKMIAATNDSNEPMKVTTLENNELWAFVPPAVLPGMPTTYPGTHQLLLDGSPVIKDVVATQDNTLSGYKFRLERTETDAQAGAGVWRTILIQSFGAGRPGYFALDVTEPVPSVDGSTGPKFLWQLITAEDGTALFGAGGATPLITTVFVDDAEVAVAVLPGGFGSAGTDDGAGNGCPRKTTDFTRFGTSFPPRSSVPCYSGTAVLARSLTVVRLDSGEILRTFRSDASEVPLLEAKGLVTEAPLDSPLTGSPVAFPSDVGAVADRLFIGDQDGTLWRLNFSSDDDDPADWELELFFDGYPTGGSFGHDWNDGQPIATPPIISVDTINNLTVAFSTGEQEAIGAVAGVKHYVWSLLEKPNDARTELLANPNWHLTLDGTTFAGDRVIGPMALFNGNLYFSTVGPGDNTDGCSSGSGKVFGMHYLLPNPAGTGKGGKPAPDLAGLLETGGFINANTLLGSDSRAFLAGATVTREVTCDNDDSPSDDTYFSYGAHKSLGALSTARFQLIIPTGDKQSTSSDPRLEPISLGSVNAVAVNLEAPSVVNRIDSWAAVIE